MNPQLSEGRTCDLEFLPPNGIIWFPSLRGPQIEEIGLMALLVDLKDLVVKPALHCPANADPPAREPIHVRPVGCLTPSPCHPLPNVPAIHSGRWHHVYAWIYPAHMLIALHKA